MLQRWPAPVAFLQVPTSLAGTDTMRLWFTLQTKNVALNSSLHQSCFQAFEVEIPLVMPVMTRPPPFFWT